MPFYPYSLQKANGRKDTYIPQARLTVRQTHRIDSRDVIWRCVTSRRHGGLSLQWDCALFVLALEHFHFQRFEVDFDAGAVPEIVQIVSP